MYDYKAEAKKAMRKELLKLFTEDATNRDMFYTNDNDKKTEFIMDEVVPKVIAGDATPEEAEKRLSGNWHLINEAVDLFLDACGTYEEPIKYTAVYFDGLVREYVAYSIVDEVVEEISTPEGLSKLFLDDFTDQPIEPTTQKITRYKKGNFFIDIVEGPFEYEAWLSHECYGVSMFMIGEDKEEVTPEEFMDSVLFVLPDFVDDYRNEFMKK